ncbi:MAG TPA: FGGY family carbohydrate kinase [Candidatus Hydrogenedentes bacterium]|nr:FGGY family carbohydrate kinase [Candidatus Hydrogenedentota bacterium]
MRTVIGVDIGTQGTKAALFSERGETLAQAFCPSELHRPKPGVVEEDPERQVRSVRQTIRSCIKKAGVDAASIKGIGIDGQMAGVIGINAAGRHVTHYDSWLDTRCAPYIAQMERKAGDEIVRKAGCPPSFNHGPKILWWMHERKTVYRTIASFVQPGAYAAMRLCGLDASRAFIDTTYLHFSGFADNRAARWDADLCQAFRLDPAKLAAVVAPNALVGELTPAMARACGAKAGTPVVAGCGDTAASFLAAGAVCEGVCVDVAGTASVFAGTTRTFAPDTESRTLGCGRSAVPGFWHPYAYINGGGMNLEWFRALLAEGGGGKRRKALSLDRLDALAARVDLREEVPLFAPHLGGRVCPSQPGLRGAWTGLSWSHTAAHLYRAVLESVALEYAIYGKLLVNLYGRTAIQKLHVTGGGDRSAVWNAIKADAQQIPVGLVERTEGAPLGSALVAGYGVGLFSDLSATARKWIRIRKAVRPRKAMAAYNASRLVKYEEMLALLEKGQ